MNQDSNSYTLPNNIKEAYLFQEVGYGTSLLEEDTYILDALNSANKKYGVCVDQEMYDVAYAVRWPKNKMPLKVCPVQDFKYLFTPAEIKSFNALVKDITELLTETLGEDVSFQIVSQVAQADIVIKYRKSDKPIFSHCTPVVGIEKQILKAEIILNYTKGVPETRLKTELLHNFLHALGLYGHSHNCYDCGFKAGPLYAREDILLTPRDQKTLRLLYRIPIGITRQELLLLWDRYLSSQPVENIQPMNIEQILDSEKLSLHTLSMLQQVKPVTATTSSTELSGVEKALRQAFKQYLAQLETA
jgi:predicted Zn-dependent protease